MPSRRDDFARLIRDNFAVLPQLAPDSALARRLPSQGTQRTLL